MTPGTLIDELDLRILDALQEGIPIVSRPWEMVAGRLDIRPEVFLERLERMSRAGIVRGISPIIEPGPVGIAAATLVALPVPGEQIQEVARIVSGYKEVSHNFRRDHHFSLWFTLSAKDEETLQGVLEEILERTGFTRGDALDLPTENRIKIDVRFSLSGTGGSHGSA